jgi:hypothetical protein
MQCVDRRLAQDITGDEVSTIAAWVGPAFEMGCFSGQLAIASAATAQRSRRHRYSHNPMHG